MQKNMIMMTVISLIGLSISGAVYYFTGSTALFSAAVTFGTMLYHFAMRLAVGYLIDAKYHNHMDHTGRWFAERAFERELYKQLRVKKWKKRLPTYTPQNFDLTRHSVTEVVQATCQAEVVHEVNMALSFVPVLLSLWLGSAGVFALTSFAAFLFDSIFVIIQRYNRPRLIRLIKKADSGSKGAANNA